MLIIANLAKLLKSANFGKCSYKKVLLTRNNLCYANRSKKILEQQLVSGQAITKCFHIYFLRSAIQKSRAYFFIFSKIAFASTQKQFFFSNKFGQTPSSECPVKVK